MEATEQREATYHLLVRLPITQKQLKGTGSQLMVVLNHYHFSPPINPLEFNPFRPPTRPGFSIWSELTGKLKWLLFNFCPTVFAASYGCPE